MTDQAKNPIAFPTLSAEQLDSIAACASAATRCYKDGDILFSPGSRNYPFYVVRSGEIAILDRSGDAEQTIVVHRVGNFVGDISYLTDGPAMVGAVARGDLEVIEIPRTALRHMLNQCPNLSDTILKAFIARRQMLRESPDFTGLRVIGSRYSADTFRIRDFLAKNRALFTWVDVETDPRVDALLKTFGITEADTPVVTCGTGFIMRNPSNRELADKIGLHQVMDGEVYDLVVVGAGPSGLAAAVYGASEGLKTVVLESSAPGGQAGISMRIENYLGFPTGLTGAELAESAILQADKFGAKITVPSAVLRMEFDNAYAVVHLDGGEARESVTAKCLLIATGAEYRKLDVEGCERFQGAGVFYSATFNEAQIYKGEDVIVVGGGNSAGQAAVFLAQSARTVLLLVRGGDLYKNMSSYLAHRIEQTPNIEVLLNTTIQRMSGDDHLESVVLVNSRTNEERFVKTPAVFSFIGALPCSDWLPPEIERDAKGFVVTGLDAGQSPLWKLRRQPFLLETSRPGVFAAGDIRAGSVKRVASAVGEGSMAVQFVHEYMKEL